MSVSVRPDAGRDYRSRYQKMKLQLSQMNEERKALLAVSSNNAPKYEDSRRRLEKLDKNESVLVKKFFLLMVNHLSMLFGDDYLRVLFLSDVSSVLFDKAETELRKCLDNIVFIDDFSDNPLGEPFGDIFEGLMLGDADEVIERDPFYTGPLGGDKAAFYAFVESVMTRVRKMIIFEFSTVPTAVQLIWRTMRAAFERGVRYPSEIVPELTKEELDGFRNIPLQDLDDSPIIRYVLQDKVGEIDELLNMTRDDLLRFTDVTPDTAWSVERYLLMNHGCHLKYKD